MKAALVLLLAVGLGGCDRYTYRQNRAPGGGTELLRTDRISGKTEALRRDQWVLLDAPTPAPADSTASASTPIGRLPADQVSKVSLRLGGFNNPERPAAPQDPWAQVLVDARRGQPCIRKPELSLVLSNGSGWTVTSVRVQVSVGRRSTEILDLRNAIARPGEAVSYAVQIKDCEAQAHEVAYSFLGAEGFAH